MSDSNRAGCETDAAPFVQDEEVQAVPIQVGWGGLADISTAGHGRPSVMTTYTPTRSGGPTRRTQFVFAAFAVAMTGAMAILAIDAPQPAGGFPLVEITPLGDRSEAEHDLLFPADGRLDRDRWTGIVVHHLGDPFGTPESIHRKHLSWGYQGLGYHFLLGNGNGLADGEIHVGYRWIEQLPGAHVIGEAGRDHNEHSIGICLVGNGDRQPYTPSQIRNLARLVQRIQQECGIPEEAVYLHSELSPSLTSPGRLFPEADFRSQLLDLPR